MLELLAMLLLMQSSVSFVILASRTHKLNIATYIRADLGHSQPSPKVKRLKREEKDGYRERWLLSGQGG